MTTNDLTPLNEAGLRGVPEADLLSAFDDLCPRWRYVGTVGFRRRYSSPEWDHVGKQTPTEMTKADWREAVRQVSHRDLVEANLVALESESGAALATFEVFVRHDAAERLFEGATPKDAKPSKPGRKPAEWRAVLLDDVQTIEAADRDYIREPSGALKVASDIVAHLIDPPKGVELKGAYSPHSEAGRITIGDANSGETLGEPTLKKLSEALKPLRP